MRLHQKSRETPGRNKDSPNFCLGRNSSLRPEYLPLQIMSKWETFRANHRKNQFWEILGKFFFNTVLIEGHFFENCQKINIFGSLLQHELKIKKGETLNFRATLFYLYQKKEKGPKQSTIQKQFKNNSKICSREIFSQLLA